MWCKRNGTVLNRQLLCKPKDPIPDLLRSGVVYKIPCLSCPATYIGQTCRRLQQHIKEHQRAVKQADFNSSALAEHAWSCEHPVDWKNTMILANPQDQTSRIVEEAVAIRTTKDTLNRDSGALPVEYNLFRLYSILYHPSYINILTSLIMSSSSHHFHHLNRVFLCFFCHICTDEGDCMATETC